MINKPFTMGPSQNPGISEKANHSEEILQAAVENGAVKIFPTGLKRKCILDIGFLICAIGAFRDRYFSGTVCPWTGTAIDAELTQKNAEEVYVGLEAPSGEGWEQDSDTLDTRFSSGLWTFSTLGWPDTDAVDLKNDIIRQAFLRPATTYFSSGS